jgi:ADP-ribosylglycohydrolase
MDDTLQDLVALAEAGRLRVSPAALRLLEPVAARPAPPWSRVRGMLLGLAIGDALGNTTEGRLPHVRRSEHGEIRDYLPHRLAGGRRVGLASDDTQLAFALLQVLLDRGRPDPGALLDRFATTEVFGMGGTTSAALKAWRSGSPWTEAGQPSAGNGALMRIAPVLLPHLRGGGFGLWRDTIVATAVTHNDPMAIGASVAWVDLLFHLLHANSAPEPSWILDRWSSTVRAFEPDIVYAPRGAAAVQAPTWRAAQVDVRRAIDGGLPTLAALNRWHSGAYLLETVPTLLLLVARYADDPEEAVIRAVNDTKDNDTCAALVGAAMGALYGDRAWPGRWIEGLTGRLGVDDDGAVQGLIEAARRKFET